MPLYRDNHGSSLSHVERIGTGSHVVRDEGTHEANITPQDLQPYKQTQAQDMQVASSDKVMDSEYRPRSFSDASQSSGRYSYLKTFQNNQEGRPVKVFVCRESQVVTKKDTDMGLQGSDTGRVEGERSKTTKGHVRSPVSRSKSTVGRVTSSSSGDLTPSKPKLPANYRQFLAQHSRQPYEPKTTSGILKQAKDESQATAEDLEGQKGTRSETKTHVPSARKFSLQNNLGTQQHNTGTNRLVRQQSATNLENISKFPGVVYRHLDDKLKSDILKKELNNLRTSQHVRKRSETVRQRISSEDRPKSTGDLHVRFADEIENLKEETNLPNTHKTIINTDLNSEKGAIRKKTIVQSLSYDSDHSRSNFDERSKLIDNRQLQGVVRNPIPPNSGSYPQSGVPRDISVSNTGPRTREQKQIIAQGQGDSKSHQPRQILQRVDKGQGQIRSRSETNLNRNLERSRTVDSERSLSSNKNYLKHSKSSSNLYRKQDTIRRNDHSEDRLKSRERIRENYRHQQNQGHNRQRSLSPVSPGNPVKQDNKPRDSGVIANAKSSNHSNQVVTKDNKTVGDNRSDEEKYAALSRQKILHSKSSSLDSQLTETVSAPKKTDHAINKADRMRLVFNKSSSSTRLDSRKLISGTYSAASVARLQGETSASLDSLDKFYLNENKGVKFEKFNTDLPIDNTKHDKTKVGDVSKVGPVQGQIVVRQCRIGEDVAFGIVGLAKTKPNGNGYLDGQGLVTIRMIPDEQGRFGFNVKGGADQGMPIIVSRVAPNTPADNAIPRLNEGDQVLFINGRDVSQHTHEQVVNYIRQSRETRSKELVLIVRPNAYVGDGNSDEPNFEYDPSTHQITSETQGANALDMSLKLLEESLDSGAALAQFEQLYRKKPGMTMNCARLEANIPKNRYRDISPYDQTRVILKSSDNSDYINANYVNMEIPISGIVNRYIAAQGPLPTTCTDFWQMVWEQQSTLVVMLTTKVEKGRIKCHQYWPDLYETSDYGHLQITCVKEEETESFAFREFNLTNVETGEERHISYMQYIGWPDHGVPDDPADFLDFVIKVRQKRVGLVEPTIVHCSAGIGRTGVLITMETAMCLIEANQPVYPLSIVRQMRDQRAMLIQTANQYKFVCEAILRCFNEGIVKALPEYQQR